MATISRRQLMAMGGSAAVGAVVGGLSVAALTKGEEPAPATPAPSPSERLTFAEWRRTRRAPYFIGHRGAGGVVPEHTLPSYQRALDWGGSVLEISVVRSRDGEVYCLHDLDLDRTTTLKGPAASQTSAVLDTARVVVSRLGPHWEGAGAPRLSKLADVLAALGGRAVLCVEAKDDSAYPAMVKLLEDTGLRDTAMIKMTGSSPRLPIAKAAEYPVYAYLGNSEVATRQGIDRLAKRLDRESDALVLPCYDGPDLFPATLIRHAVNTGIPVWVVPIHRRYEVSYFSQLGVEGMVTADLGYVTGAEPVSQLANFASGALSAGQLTRDPYSDGYALDWEPDTGVVGLDMPDRPSFLTFGDLGPIRAESYRVSFDLSFASLPKDTYEHVSIAFGQADDRYYEHRLGNTDGFHAILRADGEMAVYAHLAGSPFGKLLAPSKRSTPLKSGVWARLTLDVTPELIRWARDDGSSVEVRDRRFRGGYFHIGRSANDGKLLLRNVSVT